jgi:hypothetical protein
MVIKRLEKIQHSFACKPQTKLKISGRMRRRRRTISPIFKKISWE